MAVNDIQQRKAEANTAELELNRKEYPDVTASEITDNDLPVITRDEPSHITLVWPNDQIVVDAQRFTDKGQAEITIWWDNPNFRMLVAQDRIDLLSPSSKRAFISQLNNANNALRWLHWDWIVRCITWKVLGSVRKGSPVEEVWPDENSILTPEYLVYPMLYLNHPTIIFGDYASLKSTMALIVGFIVQLPYPDNGLGLTLQDKHYATNTLYLDYEGDNHTFTKRWSAIWKGFKLKARAEGKDEDLPKMPVLYRRMDTKFAESIDAIQGIVIENKIKLIIVDSLGPAVKGNLNDPEPAMEYNQALRRLGITSLTLAHNSKDPLTKQKSIFGSVFFSNLARAIWLCRIEGEREPGDNEAIVSLKHTKASFADLYGTLGYKFKFTDSTIKAETIGLEETKLSGELPLTKQIISLLKEGALTAKELAEATDRNLNTIRVTLNRMKDKQVCKLLEQKWGPVQKNT